MRGVIRLFDDLFWFFRRLIFILILLGWMTGNSHGSACFANRKELKKLQNEDGLLIGRNPGTGQLLRYEVPAHLITLAPTRAWKGVGTVIPNRLAVERSVLVSDPGSVRKTGTVRSQPSAYY